MFPLVTLAGPSKSDPVNPLSVSTFAPLSPRDLTKLCLALENRLPLLMDDLFDVTDERFMVEVYGVRS